MIVYLSKSKANKMTCYYLNNNAIYFDNEFNSPLSGDIIELIKKVDTIYFGMDFNQPVDNLPSKTFVDSHDSCIRKINFGHSFNQPVDNLPNGVVELLFSSAFNQPLDNLPSSVNKIEICGMFNHHLDHLPSNLKYLSLICGFSQPLNNLPDSLEYIKLFCHGPNLRIDKIPPNLKTFILHTENTELFSKVQLLFPMVTSMFID